jgi:hypothetical protein
VEELTDPASVFGSDVGSKLIAIHDALDNAEIEHAFGGAIALAYAVPEPRATMDIDINVAVPVERAASVIDALPDGVRARAGVLERIAREGQDRLRWGDVPIDLFFPQHRFHAVVASRTLLEPFRDTAIPVITPTDLTVFKALFNRRKDWPDIESMLRAGVVDEAEALRWVAAIVGADHPSCLALVELIHEVRSTPNDETNGDPNVWTD